MTPVPGVTPGPGVTPVPGVTPAVVITRGPGVTPITGVTPGPGVTPGSGTGPGGGAGPGGGVTPGGAGPGGGTGPGGSAGESSRRAGVPAAPSGLAAAIDCNSTALSWTRSPDADAYQVFRIEGGSRIRLAVLGRNAAAYTDATLLSRPGPYQYQVVALRGGRPGAPATVSARRPASCPVWELAPNAADLALTLRTLTTDQQHGATYCYVSVVPGRFDRVPGPGQALVPSVSTPRGFDLSQLPNRGRFVLTGHPANQPFTLRLECWARNVRLVERLGEVQAVHPPADWNGTLRQARTTTRPGFEISYCLGPNRPDACQTGGVLEAGTFVPLGEWMLMPRPTNLRFANSNTACDEAGGGAREMRCRLNGETTLYWDWTGNAVYPESALTGFRVKAEILGRDAPAVEARTWWERDVAPGSRRFTLAFPNQVLACGQRVIYSARSAPSNTISLYAPACAAVEAARVTVSWETTVIGPGNLGDVRDLGEPVSPGVPDPALEVRGIMVVQRLPVVYWPGWTGNSGLGIVSTAGGTFTMEHQNLRGDTEPEGRTGNNSIAATLRDGDSLTINVIILEGDTVSQTELCRLGAILPRRSAAEWARYDEVLSSAPIVSDEASCQVTVRVRGEPAR